MDRAPSPNPVPAAQPPAALVQAMQWHRAGRLGEAEAAYRAVLAHDPGQADALHLLGLAVAARGDAPQALEWIGRSLARRPDHSGTLQSLGATLATLHRPVEAMAALRRALAIDPRNAHASQQLGALLLERGNPAAAVAVLQAALEHAPGLVAALNNLGLGLRALGRLGAARSALERAALQAPQDAQVWRNLAVVLRELGCLEEAVAAGRRAVALAPDDSGACAGLAAALREAGQAEAALACFERAAALARPADAQPRVGQATVLMELGRKAEAAQAVEQALARDPCSGAAWLMRSALKTFRDDDPELAAMEAALASAPERRVSDEERIELGFALGKAWLDAGDAGRAFGHFDAANRRRRASVAYDAAATSRSLAAVARAFPRERLQRWRGTGAPSELPVFIVGMPRSGTSLVEQILASHSQAQGAGELGVVGELVAAQLAQAGPRAGFPEALDPLDAAQLRQLGQAYLARVAPLAQGRARLVDKMPLNFQYAGLIHLMLPGARILHCRRDPVDTCLSCYTTNLRGRLGFCFDQRELGKLYRDYERLMAHWRATLPPECFLEVDYEQVVADLEGQARRLLDFCGLPWEEACRSFHETRRVVQTASMNQVRQPIYRSSVGRWRTCAPYLGPLLEALGHPEAAQLAPAA
jgi:tetratricopeptide (TPR) repeat protein